MTEALKAVRDCVEHGVSNYRGLKLTKRQGERNKGLSMIAIRNEFGEELCSGVTPSNAALVVRAYLAGLDAGVRHAACAV